MLEKPAQPGFHGRAAPLERITGADAAGDESGRAHRIAAWRNERVNAQYVVWSDHAVAGLKLAVSDFTAPCGAKIPAGCAKARFVRYTMAGQKNRKGEWTMPRRLVGDCLDAAPAVDLPANGFRPVWLTVSVPKDAAPGAYTGTLTVAGANGETIAFTLALDVRHEVLPDPKQWKFFLDLWQHPWAVARYNDVKPFSKEHYALLEPLYRELANGGQKTVTTTLVDLPWNHQNFDAYWTMVEHVKQADGSFRHDFTLFDEYVAFALKCGLGPQIHCYTMASWGNIVYFRDAKTGGKIKVKLPAGTPEHEAFWGPFLEEFQAHVKAKGWLGNVYIALDERSREELMATADCIRRHAPGLKIQMAGNKPPSTFEGIEIHNYSQTMQYGFITPKFLEEAKARRARGLVTTSYICCAPAVPNTFTTSSLAEARFLGVYAYARGLDGMLRWAAFNWPKDPLDDSTYGDWAPGDTYLLYPGARTSTRWEALRDSIETYEKIRVLADSGLATWHLQVAFNGIDWKALSTGKPADFDARVRQVEDAIDGLSTPGCLNGRRVERIDETYGAECGYAQPVKEIYLVQHPTPEHDRPGRPLYVVLHSSGHNCVNSLLCTRAPDNHDIYRAPDDFYALYLDCKMAAGTDWWWGYNHCHGFENSPCERRCLATIEKVVRKYGIDRDRIYLCGNSMGGSGCLGFGLRNGDVFAAAKANVPALVEHACDRMGWSMKTDADAAGADLSRLPEPPLMIDHSAPNDMHWSTGHEHLFRMMNARKYPWISYWADHKHCNRNSLILAKNDVYLSFDWTSVRKSDILPVFTRASTDTPYPWPDRRDAPGAGQINAFFQWRDGRDTARDVSITLLVGAIESKHFAIPATITADVTLRRLRALKVRPGDVFDWTFGAARGTVTVGKDGLLTVPNLAVSKTPQTLRLARR